MPAPNSLEQVFQWYWREHNHPSRSWVNLCQMSVRMAWGLPAVYGSAWAQYLGAKAAGDLHGVGKPVTDAPLGAALCYKGSSPYGHIVTAAAPFKDDTPACWSNDLVRRGGLDRAARTAPTTQWGQAYLGWIDAVSGYELNLNDPKRPATPRHPKRYQTIAKAIEDMESAHEIAVKANDTADIEVLDKEVRRLKRMHDRLRMGTA